MTRSQITALRDQLTTTDIAILKDVATYRLLSTQHIRRLHFDPHRPTPLAAARACTRTLVALRTRGLLTPLQRHIGGIRAGSAGYVWYLGPTGDRLLRLLDDTATTRGRRNYREPSRHFVAHTLAVSELAVQTIQLQQANEVEILTLRPEPGSWHTTLTKVGATTTLKPDLHLVTASGDFEDHRFIEVDLASEHQPVIRRQCRAYQTYRATGRYQHQHHTFPLVIWVVPTPSRQQQIQTWIDHDPHLDPGAFQVITTDHYQPLIRGDRPDPGRTASENVTTTPTPPKGEHST